MNNRKPYLQMLRTVVGMVLLGIGMLGCQPAPCTEATPGAWAGQGFLFVQYPDAGPVYQLVFFPACAIDTVHFMRSLPTELQEGINFGLAGPRYKAAIRRAAHSFRAQNSRGHWEQVQVCPVYLRYSKAEDLTFITSGEQKLDLKYTWEKGALNQRYFYTTNLELDTLEFLPYQP